MQFSDPFKAAQALLGQQPLPADAAEQLEALEQQILPEEAQMFGFIWSAYYAANDNPKLFGDKSGL